ncbi:hypothetical protein LP414_19265 [Polaromonas sp. P1(28)-13]|nr:hypothetical protein LP414_19265 [Polaromonas sp. P1(28)-13]
MNRSKSRPPRTHDCSQERACATCLRTKSGGEQVDTDPSMLADDDLPVELHADKQRWFGQFSFLLPVTFVVAAMGIAYGIVYCL